jgi:anti-anti-sigma factor
MSLPPLHISRVVGPDQRVDLVVRGEIDVSSCGALDAAIRSEFDADRRVVELDLTGVGFADSSAPAVLLRCRQRLGSRLRIGACSPPVSRLIEISGTGAILI